MSSILKALKKLEEENARRRGETADIARDILRGEERSSSKPWLLGVLVAGLLLMGGLSGMLLVQLWPAGAPDTVDSGVQQKVPLMNQEPPAQGIPPDAAVPESTEKPLPAPVSGATAAEPSVKDTSFPQPVPIADASQPTDTGDHTATRDKSAIQGETTVGLQSLSPVLEQAPPASGYPDLEITGIVFSSDPRERLAVVNGLPVMAGTLIEGVRVEEILADRVRFEKDGQLFEVALKK